jgi:hypothetical protein
MNQTSGWLRAASLLAVILSSSVFADEPPLSQQEMSEAEVGALELDKIEVTGSLTVQQEAALRIVRQALDQPRSLKRKDFDKWRCWFDQPLGTRLNYLHCARNGDLWALQPRGEGGSISASDLNPVRYGDYGQVLVSTRPMTEAKVRRMTESLVGTGENDLRFIQMVLGGEKPPRDVPSDAELERFASAWSRLEALSEQGASEDRQISAIEQAGLTLDRYNRIATLVEDHTSIRDEVASILDK